MIPQITDLLTQDDINKFKQINIQTIKQKDFYYMFKQIPKTKNKVQLITNLFIVYDILDKDKTMYKDYVKHFSMILLDLIYVNDLNKEQISKLIKKIDKLDTYTLMSNMVYDFVMSNEQKGYYFYVLINDVDLKKIMLEKLKKHFKNNSVLQIENEINKMISKYI